MRKDNNEVQVLSKTRWTFTTTDVQAIAVSDKFFVVKSTTTFTETCPNGKEVRRDIREAQGLVQASELMKFNETGILNFREDYKSNCGVGILFSEIRDLYTTQGRYKAHMDLDIANLKGKYKNVFDRYCVGEWEASDLVIFDRNINNSSVIFDLEGKPLPFPIDLSVVNYDAEIRAHLQSQDRTKFGVEGYPDLIEFIPTKDEMTKILALVDQHEDIYNEYNLCRAVLALDILGLHKAGLMGPGHELYDDSWRDPYQEELSLPSP